jgi:hypothetical protein
MSAIARHELLFASYKSATLVQSGIVPAFVVATGAGAGPLYCPPNDNTRPSGNISASGRFLIARGFGPTLQTLFVGS